ncbi:MAG TPA: hypothetical protein VG028_00210 [Terriglobia bacterium]|nr:hypothetical protein [Terriglobia bacterium]
MKKDIPMQLYVGLGILLIGGVLLGGEYFLVKWAPLHKQRVVDETLKQLPYHNQSLGVDIQVAAGIFGQVENFAGGVKISRSRFWGVGPSLIITSEPNVDHASEFSQEILAKWETDGVLQNIPRYRFDHTKLADRDAVLIQRYKDHALWLTAHVMSPDRIIVADCTTGGGDQALLLEACDESLRSITVAGTASSTPVLEGVTPPGTTPPRIIPKK